MIDIGTIAQWPATAIIAFAFLYILYDLVKQRKETTKERKALSLILFNHLAALLETNREIVQNLKDLRWEFETFRRDFASHRTLMEQPKPGQASKDNSRSGVAPDSTTCRGIG